ncbi:MAG: InlB B-repeat-containing protein [Clostridia bacterium]|nr:InlB B-repeat-containing protein [Clostridia bacterium]
MKRSKRLLSLVICLLTLCGVLQIWPAAYAYEITDLYAARTLPEAGAAPVSTGTLICCYDDDTGLYPEGEPDENGRAEMEFTPIDPFIRQIVIRGFTKPALGGAVEEHTTAWADATMFGAEYETVSQGWFTNVGFSPLAKTYTFLGNTNYFSEIVVAPKNGYSFAADATVTLNDINGNEVALSKIERRGDGTIMLRTEVFLLSESIETVRIYDFVPPTLGLRAQACRPRISDGAEFNDIAWFNVTDGVTMDDDDCFEAGKIYYLMFTVKAASGWYLTNDTVVEVTRQRSFTRVDLKDSIYLPGPNVIVCSSENMPTAVRYTNIQIGGYRAPVVDQNAGDPSDILIPGDNGLIIARAFWSDSSCTPLRTTDKFRADERYSLCVYVDIENGYFDINSPFDQVRLYDLHGDEVPLQWEGAGDHAIGYEPGTDNYRFCTEFSYPVNVIAPNKTELYVTFVNNGHGETPPEQILLYGVTAMKPSDPDEDGWYFTGWYSDPDCSDPYYFSTPVTDNLILYAGWEDSSNFIEGDMDRDGEITVADALAALRIAAKLAEASGDDLLIGDIDGNGKIEVDDALAILRVAAKLAGPSSL